VFHAVAVAAMLAAAPTSAQDLATQARALLAQGLSPEAAALRLLDGGVYPEDIAAALFRISPHAVRAVSFAMVRAGAAGDAGAALPLAADIAGLAQPAAVPAAAALALSVPDQAAAGAAALAQAVPQAAPLIAATMARLVAPRAAEIAAAAARAVPQQAIFVASAVSLALPAAKDAVFAAVGAATGLPGARIAVLADASEAVGANALREADEALAGLPLPGR
jgi:hypothetical protein